MGLSLRAFLAKINGFGVPFWLKLRGKSENRDFVKIVLPLKWEHDFQGSDHPKIDLECDFERRWSKKSMTTASGAILGSAFFILGRFFIDFGVQFGSQTGLFGSTLGRLSRLFGQLWATMWFFFDRGFSRGGCWDRFWVCWKLSREGFWELFGRSLHRLGRLSHLRFVPSSSQVCPNSRSVVVLPLVAGLGCPALQLQGRWSRGAC